MPRMLRLQKPIIWQPRPIAPSATDLERVMDGPDAGDVAVLEAQIEKRYRDYETYSVLVLILMMLPWPKLEFRTQKHNW